MSDTERTALANGQAELIGAGFRPQRYGAGVRLVRRLIWPFMRPFAFHLLARIEELEKAQKQLEEDAGLRSDLTALANRLASAEDTLERLADDLPTRPRCGK